MKTIQQFMQQPWLYLAIVIIGFILKFYRIEYKYFWRDEISTIEHTSGNQILKMPENEIKNITYYTDQLYLDKMELTIGSELKGLYSSVNLNPLHYTFLMVWYRVVGDNPMNYRLFNIFILVLTLPILFFLAKSLFKSDLAGWIAISLFVFSPYWQLYMYQARYNIFGVFLIISLHYLFLQAVTKKKLKWWIGYSIVGILSLYASVLSGLMIFGHFIYILFIKKEIRTIYCIILLLIAVCYLPWIISMINNREEIATSLNWHTYFGYTQNPLKLLLYQFVGYNQFFKFFTSIFEQAQYVVYGVFKGNFGNMVADLVLLILIFSSIVYTVKRASSNVFYYLIFIVLPFILFFLVSDITRKSLASMIWRYHGINQIGILLFVVYMIQRKISQGKLYFASIYAGLIIIGFISIMVISHDRSMPFGADDSLKKITTAKMFSEAKKPLIIADSPYGQNIDPYSFIALLNECSSDKIDILRASPDIENVLELLENKNYSKIYVTHSSDDLIQNLKNQFGGRMDSLEIEGILPAWQINYP